MTSPGPYPPSGDQPYGSPGPVPPPAWGQAPYGGGLPGQQPPTAPGPGWPGGYGQPPYGGYPYQPPRPTNGLAVASLVLGILWIYWLGSILALVFGYVAKQQIRDRGESGDGMATAGIVLGWVGVGIFALFLLLGVASFV